MKKILSISILLVAFGGLLAACGSDSGDDNVKVSDVWARVTAPGQENGAVYATLESSTDNKLTGASVPGDVAAKTELHETGETEGSEMSGDGEMSGESKNATGHDRTRGTRSQADAVPKRPTQLACRTNTVGGTGVASARRKRSLR